MPRRRGSSVWRACLTATALVLPSGCHQVQVLRHEEEPPRPWDLAWLFPLDELGRVVQEPRRFEAGSAGVELVEAATGYLIVGLALDAIPARQRVRIDRGRLDEAEILLPSSTYEELVSNIHISVEGDRVELGLDGALAHVDRVGPRSLEPGTAITSSTTLGLVARLPAFPNHCEPVRATNRSPLEGTRLPIYRRRYVELRPLADDSFIGAVNPALSPNFTGPGALVRLRPSTAVTNEDVVVLPGSQLAGITNHGLRHLSLRPSAPGADDIGAFVVQLEVAREATLVPQVSRVHHLALPRTGPWNTLPYEALDVAGPEVLMQTLPALSVAESPRGDIIVVGGRNIIDGMNLVPTGFIAISPASTATVSFRRHELVFSGRTNGDVLMRAAALPPHADYPGQSIFAIGARRGEIVLVAYEAGTQVLREIERWAPPPDLTAMAATGYRDLNVVDRPDGYELWAVGEQGLLVRRTALGRWQMITNLMRDEGLVDESAQNCTPVGYPRGRLLMGIARRGNTALLTLENCHGAMLLRFDEDDELLCATAVLPPERSELVPDAMENFDAVLAVDTGYYMLHTFRLELMHVAVEH